eukprot:457865-Pyramimonas_sp.AAC.1
MGGVVISGEDQAVEMQVLALAERPRPSPSGARPTSASVATNGSAWAGEQTAIGGLLGAGNTGDVFLLQETRFTSQQAEDSARWRGPAT